MNPEDFLMSVDDDENLLDLSFEEWFARVRQFEQKSLRAFEPAPPMAHIITERGQMCGFLCGVPDAEGLKLALKTGREALAGQLSDQIKYIVVALTMLLTKQGVHPDDPNTRPEDVVPALVLIGQHEGGLKLEVYARMYSNWMKMPEGSKAPTGVLELMPLLEWDDKPPGPTEMFRRVRM